MIDFNDDMTDSLSKPYHKWYCILHFINDDDLSN